MSFPELVAVLVPTDSRSCVTAFESVFSLHAFSVKEEYGASRDQNGKTSGCNVPLVNVNIHCSQPHLECAAHVLPKSCGFVVSNAIRNGEVERAVLITPEVTTLGESGEHYPVGNLDDKVLSRNAVERALINAGCSSSDSSILIRIRSEHLPLCESRNEILNWPYLTSECSSFLNSRFSHLRTNAPSIDRMDSQGGMWSHCIFFGIAECQKNWPVEECPRRTVGELFNIPSNIEDGPFLLICPYIEMGLDCAITAPLLYKR